MNIECTCPKCRLRYRDAALNEAAAAVRWTPAEELREKIAASRSAMQLPALKLRRTNIGQLKRIWRETVEQAKAQGLIE